MPRIPRGQLAGHAYHVLNRGTGGAVVFHKEADYAAFLALLETAKLTFPVHVFAFCLMPNHFHLVLQSTPQDALSPFMQWWMTSQSPFGSTEWQAQFAESVGLDSTLRPRGRPRKFPNK